MIDCSIIVARSALHICLWLLIVEYVEDTPNRRPDRILALLTQFCFKSEIVHNIRSK